MAQAAVHPVAHGWSAAEGPVCRQLTWPQFVRRDSFAILRLYQGILELTWWGTWTLMSWHSTSTLQATRVR